MGERKRIYILYPDGILAYAPSVLNLYDALSNSFDVTIYAYEPEKYFSDQKVSNRQIKYLKKPGWPKRMLFATLYHLGVTFFKTPTVGRYRFKRQMNLLWQLRFDDKPEAIIAVDLASLWVAQKVHHHVHFLSLEIHEKDPLISIIQTEKVRSAIFQSEIRFQYLFPQKDVPVFYIPNAPVFREIDLPVQRERLLYNGTAIPEFGIFKCIEYIHVFPGESMTIKGAVPVNIENELREKYTPLFQSGRLEIDRTYIESSELIPYLSQFKIGFCFYDLSFERINTFNYITAPSGKMFAYLAAGVPVIGNAIPGLKTLEEYNCGVLIDEITPEKINQAVQRIENNYPRFCENALSTARKFSFEKTVAPFIEFLHKEIETKTT